VKKIYANISALLAIVTLVITSWITEDWAVKLDITKSLLIVTTTFCILYLITPEKSL
jgi:hypothetical protein